MEDEVPDDYESGGAWIADELQEANGITLLLVSAAYLTLADAHMRREGTRGLELMDEIERNLTESLRRFVTETPHGAARPDIILMAARKLRAVLAAGRELPREAPGLH